MNSFYPSAVPRAGGTVVLVQGDNYGFLASPQYRCAFVPLAAVKGERLPDGALQCTYPAPSNSQALAGALGEGRFLPATQALEVSSDGGPSMV